jgi:glycosyltransferase involved in cell wall biosynthesis
MKVLLANKFFFRNGGSEVVLFQERDFLRDARVEIVDFSMDDVRNLPSDFADSFVRNQSYEAGDTGRGSRLSTALSLIHSPEAVRKIGALIDRTQPDLVHCHNIYHQLTPSIIGAAKRRGVPVVLTLHDYKPVCPVYVRLRTGKVCSECLNHGFSKVVVNRCADGSLGRSVLLYAEAVVQRLLGNYEKLDAIIAPSAFMQASVAPRRFPSNRVTVIHNGVDTRKIHSSDDDGDYALYLGRLSAEKGVDTLLNAHSSISDRVRLRVAGTGPLEHELRSQHPKVRFMGHLSGAALESTIRNASVIVVPSNWYENCPMSVLEAMAYGKAVIGSDIGGIPELISHGETGFLFPPGDHIALRSQLLQLMENPTLRRQFGSAGRKRAEQEFSLERHNSALMQLYLNVIEESKAMRDKSARTEV